MILSESYSCMLTCKFDFTEDSIAGKWSRAQETYKLSTSVMNKIGNVEADYPYNVIHTRVKVKGSGKVVVMRYESTAGKDFQLIGRVTPFTAETES